MSSLLPRLSIECPNRYARVRTVIQNDNDDLFVKLDYFDKVIDRNDYLHGSFIESTRNYYESCRFTVVRITEKEVDEREYLANT